MKEQKAEERLGPEFFIKESPLFAKNVGFENLFENVFSRMHAFPVPVFILELCRGSEKS